MDEHLSVEEALSREVIRKLKLAAEAETKDDREIICEELFCDITGTLDTHAQVRPVYDGRRQGYSLRVLGLLLGYCLSAWTIRVGKCCWYGMPPSAPVLRKAVSSTSKQSERAEHWSHQSLVSSSHDPMPRTLHP